MVGDLSLARDGSVSVAAKTSVIPHSEHTLMPSSLAARSISTDGIGAPPQRNDRRLAGLGAPAFTTSQMSLRKGVEAAVYVTPSRAINDTPCFGSQTSCRTIVPPR